MLVIGVDPDSDRHGVAVYEDGILVRLSMMTRNEIVDEFRYSDCLFSVEDVASKNCVFSQKKVRTDNVNTSIGRRIGLNQQAQKELMHDFEHYSIPYILHKPSGKWKGRDSKGRKQPHEIKEFKMVTGWEKRSNEDTRSAAYMGYLGLKDAK